MRRGSGSNHKAGRASSERAGRAASGGPGLRREIGGILLLALALFLALSLGSLQLGGRLTGPGGAVIAVGLYALIGMGAWVAAVAAGVGAVRLLAGRPLRPFGGEAAAYVSATCFAAVLLHLAAGRHRLHGYSTGGLVGEYGGELLVALLGTAGTVLLAVTGLLLSLVATTPLTAAGLGRALALALRRGWRGFAQLALAAFPGGAGEESRAVQAARADPDATRPMAALAVSGVSGGAGRSRGDAPADGGKQSARQRSKTAPGAAPGTGGSGGAASQQADAASHDTAPNGTAATPPLPLIKLPPGRARAPSGTDEGDAARADARAPHPIAGDGDRTEACANPPAMTPAAGPPAIIPPIPPPAKPPSRGPQDYIRLASGAFRLPDIALLDQPGSAHAELDRQAMLDLAGRLEKTLGDYGVRGRVSEIHPGPVVTMYEFVPQAGTKLSKITALSNDLAMALEALRVRIVAPIPGKAAVGIEVPNRTRETVYFKEIVASDAFARATRSKLAMALGKDIVGNPVVVDLARMPHLLLAGTTGSGKSVSVNAMICSLLFNASPEEVKLIMIDPKMLELSIYEGIPHLLLPVVTDPKKANLALRWAVDEMERRYDLISKAGVRDIASYNKKIEKKLADGQGERGRPAQPAGAPVTPRIRIFVGDGEARREVEVEATAEAVSAAGGVVNVQILDEISAARAAAQAAAVQHAAEVEAERKLPYIVTVIDEFADLMMVASKEVEQSVARIAQKARAAGIHLMLATQRPSVDVITGLIKANFPSRIAFQVASKVDARTILDQQGAESLLGMGDMLFSDRGLALRRVHGPLVTDGEIHRVVDYLKSQGKPVYDLDILKPRSEDGEESGADDDFGDELYDQAVAVVSEMRQASTSMLQRRLRLGYNRAARMIERMEREGIVGPADGARPREVLVRSHAA